MVLDGRLAEKRHPKELQGHARQDSARSLAVGSTETRPPLQAASPQPVSEEAGAAVEADFSAPRTGGEKSHDGTVRTRLQLLGIRASAPQTRDGFKWL
ncbi:hypothetical protein B0A49_11586, partial [Cryomyces minteri]